MKNIKKNKDDNENRNLEERIVDRNILTYFPHMIELLTYEEKGNDRVLDYNLPTERGNHRL